MFPVSNSPAAVRMTKRAASADWLAARRLAGMMNGEVVGALELGGSTAAPNAAVLRHEITMNRVTLGFYFWNMGSMRSGICNTIRAIAVPYSLPASPCQ